MDGDAYRAESNLLGISSSQWIALDAFDVKVIFGHAEYEVIRHLPQVETGR